MIAHAGETTALMTELKELDLALDELGQLFAVEDDQARLALERLEEDGADLGRLDIWIRNESANFVCTIKNKV